MSIFKKAVKMLKLKNALVKPSCIKNLEKKNEMIGNDRRNTIKVAAEKVGIVPK